MIMEFVERWNKNKDALKAYFQTHEIEEYGESYQELLKLLIQIVINPEAKEKYRFLDLERLVEIDHGEYQGELIWLIPYNTYQPDASEYIWTYADYGSCSGCDTLLAIFYSHWPEKKYAQPDQVDDYMTLCLHLLQRMRPLISNEEMEEDYRRE